MGIKTRAQEETEKIQRLGQWTRWLLTNNSANLCKEVEEIAEKRILANWFDLDRLIAGHRTKVVDRRSGWYTQPSDHREFTPKGHRLLAHMVAAMGGWSLATEANGQTPFISMGSGASYRLQEPELQKKIVDTLQIFWFYGADVNEKNTAGRTLWHSAAFTGCANSLRGLHSAAMELCENTQVQRLLVQEQAEALSYFHPNARSKLMIEPIRHVSDTHKSRWRPNLNAKDSQGDTPILDALQSSSAQMPTCVRWLYDQGADIEVRNIAGVGIHNMFEKGNVRAQGEGLAALSWLVAMLEKKTLGEVILTPKGAPINTVAVLEENQTAVDTEPVEPPVQVRKLRL